MPLSSGHRRRAACGPAPERAATVRQPLRHGAAWVAGTSPAMTAGSERGYREPCRNAGRGRAGVFKASSYAQTRLTRPAAGRGRGRWRGRGDHTPCVRTHRFPLSFRVERSESPEARPSTVQEAQGATGSPGEAAASGSRALAVARPGMTVTRTIHPERVSVMAGSRDQTGIHFASSRMPRRRRARRRGRAVASVSAEQRQHPSSPRQANHRRPGASSRFAMDDGLIVMRSGADRHGRRSWRAPANPTPIRDALAPGAATSRDRAGPAPGRAAQSRARRDDCRAKLRRR